MKISRHPVSSERSVLIVSNLYPPYVIGGAEIVAHRQARQLQAMGLKVCVFAGKIPDDQTVAGGLAVEHVEGIKVYRTTLFSLDADDNFYVQRNAARLASIVRAENVDLVHFHNTSGLGAALIPEARALGCRVVVTLHDHWGFCYRGTSLRDNGEECTAPDECAIACKPAIHPSSAPVALPIRLRTDYIKWCIQHADLLLAPSDALRRSYQRAGIGVDRPFHTLSNGIDLDAIDVARPSPAGQTRFVMIAYLGEHKGVLDAIEAARLLRTDPALDGKWRLTLLGEGHLRPRLQDLVRTHGLGEYVTMPGHVPRTEVLRTLTDTDVVMLPSRWPENEPVSMLEAIASGRAQIGTRIGGIPALIDDGRSGHLIAPNDPAQLARVMRAYILDPALARRHGDYNLQRRAAFSEASVVDRLAAHYAAVMESAPLPIDQPLVVCGGDWPVVQVANLCAYLHRLETGGTKLLLVWHGWLTTEQKQGATLFWNWSSGADFQLCRTMARLGVPILAPRIGRWFATLAQMFGGIHLYDTYLEAGEFLAGHAARPGLMATYRAEIGDSATASVKHDPQASFNLPVMAAVAETH